MSRLKKALSLSRLRLIWSLCSLGLFFGLIYITDFASLKGYEVDLFLLIDPLVWLSSALTGWTIYSGLALGALIIVPTLFLGRFFCSWICPLGIINQGLSQLLRRRKISETWSENEYRRLYRLKYYILTVLIALAMFGANQIGLFDPITIITRSVALGFFPALGFSFGSIYVDAPIFLGGALISALALALFLSNRYITRFWCRALCPLGALLGLISLKAPARIRRDVTLCTDCKKCLKNCQGAADPDGEHRVSECHLCMNCIDDCPESALRYGLPEPDSSAERAFDINRRRTLEVGLAGLILYPMLKSSISSETEAQAAVIRPPGSIGEPDFLKRCIKCSMCMRVCPTNALHPALLEAGIEGIWTPILINKIGYCEHHCVLCSHVCPTGAIKPISVQAKVGSAKVEPIKLGTAFFDRGRCLPWSMDIECIVCEEVCPTTPKAIWYRTEWVDPRDGAPAKKLKRPYLTPELCIGCGACENKCPVNDFPAVRVSSVGESRSRENVMILGSNAPTETGR